MFVVCVCVCIDIVCWILLISLYVNRKFSVFFCLFVCFCFFETRFLCVALAVLELPVI